MRIVLNLKGVLIGMGLQTHANTFHRKTHCCGKIIMVASNCVIN